MKMKAQRIKICGHSRSNTKRDVYSNECIHQKRKIKLGMVAPKLLEMINKFVKITGYKTITTRKVATFVFGRIEKLFYFVSGSC